MGRRKSKARKLLRKVKLQYTTSEEELEKLEKTESPQEAKDNFPNTSASIAQCSSQSVEMPICEFKHMFIQSDNCSTDRVNTDEDNLEDEEVAYPPGIPYKLIDEDLRLKEKSFSTFSDNSLRDSEGNILVDAIKQSIMFKAIPDKPFDSFIISPREQFDIDFPPDKHNDVFYPVGKINEDQQKIYLEQNTYSEKVKSSKSGFQYITSDSVWPQILQNYGTQNVHAPWEQQQPQPQQNQSQGSCSRTFPSGLEKNEISEIQNLRALHSDDAQNKTSVSSIKSDKDFTPEKQNTYSSDKSGSGENRESPKKEELFSEKVRSPPEIQNVISYSDRQSNQQTLQSTPTSTHQSNRQRMETLNLHTFRPESRRLSLQTPYSTHHLNQPFVHPRDQLDMDFPPEKHNDVFYPMGNVKSYETRISSQNSYSNKLKNQNYGIQISSSYIQQNQQNRDAQGLQSAPLSNQGQNIQQNMQTFHSDTRRSEGSRIQILARPYSEGQQIQQHTGRENLQSFHSGMYQQQSQHLGIQNFPYLSSAREQNTSQTGTSSTQNSNSGKQKSQQVENYGLECNNQMKNLQRSQSGRPLNQSYETRGIQASYADTLQNKGSSVLQSSNSENQQIGQHSRFQNLQGSYSSVVQSQLPTNAQNLHSQMNILQSQHQSWISQFLNSSTELQGQQSAIPNLQISQYMGYPISDASSSTIQQYDQNFKTSNRQSDQGMKPQYENISGSSYSQSNYNLNPNFAYYTGELPPVTGSTQIQRNVPYSSSNSSLSLHESHTQQHLYQPMQQINQSHSASQIGRTNESSAREVYPNSSTWTQNQSAETSRGRSSDTNQRYSFPSDTMNQNLSLASRGTQSNQASRVLNIQSNLNPCAPPWTQGGGTNKKNESKQ